MSHREDLLAGAVACLREKGYAHTTARDIVAASGTNLASIGYHYGSTKALLNAAALKALDDFGEQMAQAMGADAATAVTTVERFEWFWARVIDSFRTSRQVWLATFDIFAVAQRDPQVRAAVADGIEDAQALWAQALYGVDPDRAPSPADLALAMSTIADQLTAEVAPASGRGGRVGSSHPRSLADAGFRVRPLRALHLVGEPAPRRESIPHHGRQRPTGPVQGGRVELCPYGRLLAVGPRNRPHGRSAPVRAGGRRLAPLAARCDRLSGPWRGPVAVKNLAAVGTSGGARAVRVPLYGPAPPVDGHEVVERAVQGAVVHAGRPAVGLVTQVVHLAAAGRLAAPAGPLAMLVAQDDRGPDGGRDRAADPHVQRHRRPGQPAIELLSPQERGQPARPGQEVDGLADDRVAEHPLGLGGQRLRFPARSAPRAMAGQLQAQVD